MPQPRAPLYRKSLQEIRCVVLHPLVPSQETRFDCLISISDILSYLRQSNVASCNETCQSWFDKTPNVENLFTSYEFGKRGGIPPWAFWFSDLPSVAEFVERSARRGPRKVSAGRFKATVAELETLLRHRWGALAQPRDADIPPAWSLLSPSRLRCGHCVQLVSTLLTPSGDAVNPVNSPGDNQQNPTSQEMHKTREDHETSQAMEVDEEEEVDPCSPFQLDPEFLTRRDPTFPRDIPPPQDRQLRDRLRVPLSTYFLCQSDHKGFLDQVASRYLLPHLLPHPFWPPLASQKSWLRRAVVEENCKHFMQVQ